NLGARLPATVVRLDRDLVERDPTSLGPVRRSATAALRDVRNEEPWCVADRERCVADGIASAQRLRIVSPDSCEGHALTAELRVAIGEVDPGFSELEASLDRVAERSACARRYVSLAQQTGQQVR